MSGAEVGKWLARVGLVAGAVAFLALAEGGTAQALPVGRQFAPTTSPLVWPATSADGTANDPVTIDSAEVALGDQLTDADQLTAGQHYFYVALHPNYEFAGVLAPLVLPQTSATLTTAQGTVTAVAAPPTLGDDAQWYFPVSGNRSSATLHIDGFTKVIGNERGDFTPWLFGPETITFLATSPVPSSSKGTGRVPTAANQQPPAASKAGKGSLAVPLGAGAGGLVLLTAVASGLVSLRRRRAFYRADREGRVVLAGPPIAGAAAAVGGIPPDRAAVLVKLIGPLEVEGTKGPVTAGPLLEIIVFLVLNPGKSFTSVQLRESIWGLGRQPITSPTFRSYIVRLRKAFGTGVVVTEHFRYQLTEVVTSDWIAFQASLQLADPLVGREEALSLVRGPVLHGCFDGKKNSPFAWAVGIANDIDDEVTTTAAELAGDLLDGDDAERASKAVAQGLLCAEANLRLRLMDLRVGAAIGGPREISRRLEAGRAAMAGFPKDVTELENEARTLGGDSVKPS